MAAAVWLRGGSTFYWVEPDGRIRHSEPIDPDPGRAARLIAVRYRGIPRERWELWRRRAGRPEATAAPEVLEGLTLAGLTAGAAAPPDLRSARARLPSRTGAGDRRLLIAIAHEAALRSLESPEQTLIALAREEARVERALGRELAAGGQWIAVADSPLAEHGVAQQRFADRFRQHHAELVDRLEVAAGRWVPNLSRLLGARVAARLVAAAGSRATLARHSSSRLQLLGARRRPRPTGGPRFGVIYRSIGLEELPDGQRGRYARSIAALAVIAARADDATGADLSEVLVKRRDRRRADLARRSH